VGILAITGLVNPTSDDVMEQMKRNLEADFRGRFSAGGKAAIRALPVMHAYADYYRKYDKTYHVQLQTESVSLQGRSLPSVSSLVDTMFIAELRNGLLTAGHDLNTVCEPITIDASQGTEDYTKMNGKEQTLKVGTCTCETLKASSLACSAGQMRERRSLQVPRQRCLWCMRLRELPARRLFAT
jgi:DNA/RNA-binding domain of Phe-tRNA-synthetase-like protein